MRAAATFAAGAARTCAAAAGGDRSAARLLPPSVRTEVEPAIRRYGFYVDRSAFGGDVLRDGRESRLRRRIAGSVGGQDMLESAWVAARAGLVGADAADVELLDAMVMGRAPLPTEGEPAPGREPAAAEPATSPFGEALRPYRSAAVDVRAQFVTWDFVVFEARTGGRRAYVNIPRDGLEPFLGALHRGHVDPVIRDFVSAERQTPIVLSDHSQTREPGLYDGVGDPAALVPPEREPGGRGGASVPGGRRSKQRSRRAERPRPVAAAAKRPRRALLVGGDRPRARRGRDRRGRAGRRRRLLARGGPGRLALGHRFRRARQPLAARRPLAVRVADSERESEPEPERGSRAPDRVVRRVRREGDGRGARPTGDGRARRRLHSR